MKRKNKVKELGEELAKDIDNFMGKIRDKIPEEYQTIKITAFQRFEEGYYWLKKIFEIHEIKEAERKFSSKKLTAVKEQQNGAYDPKP